MDWRYNQPASSSRQFHDYEQFSDDDDDFAPRQRQRNDQYDEREPHPPPDQSSESKQPETMAYWFQRTTSSSQAQFAATALVSGAVVAGAIFGYQHIRRQELVEDLKSSIPALSKEHKADKVRADSLEVGYADGRSEAHGFWGRATAPGIE